MGMDTYTIRVMHCPVCNHEASHRAVSAFPSALCHRCKGVKLSQFLDYKARDFMMIETVRAQIEHGYK